MKTPKQRLTLWIPAETVRQIKIRAINERTTISEMVGKLGQKNPVDIEKRTVL